METLSKFSIDSYNWDVKLFSKNRRREKRCNDCLAFDIETTSLFKEDDGVYRVYSYNNAKNDDKYYKDRESLSVPYFFQIGINGKAYYTQDWRELKRFFINLSDLGIKFYIYVHNLSFEFIFMLNLSRVKKEFSRKAHSTIYAVYEEFENIEFRCSYYLSRMSLKELSNQTTVKKLVGDLDYLKFRTPLTKLTVKEMKYCENDVLILNEYILEKKKKYGNVWDIPLTQTGEIRRVVKKLCCENGYDKVALKCQPTNIDMYRFMLACTWGGETHANYINVNESIKNVRSVDYESSYPFCMCVYKYPQTAFKSFPYTDFTKDKFMFMLDVEFVGLSSKRTLHPLPKSKCLIKGRYTEDNGRIMSADYVRIKLLDLDFTTMVDFYEFKEVNIIDSYGAMGGFMPDFFVKYVIERFAEKTKYKDVKGMEALYRTSKEFNNSIYGMSITQLVFDNLEFDNDSLSWNIELMDELAFQEALNKRLRYSSKNFLQYSFGMYNVAYGRKNLWKLLGKMDDDDVVYYDTDSDKYIHSTKNDKIIDIINAEHRKLLTDRATKIGLSEDIYNPMDKKGKKHMLGQLDREAEYDEFKTLGAKKYSYVLDEQVKTVVSGLSKKASTFFNTLDEFEDDTFIPALQSHKNVIRYIYTQEVGITLEDGFVTEFKYGAVVRPSGIHLNVKDDFLRLVGSMN